VQRSCALDPSVEVTGVYVGLPGSNMCGAPPMPPAFGWSVVSCAQ
jgi:hypothetical protein